MSHKIDLPQNLTIHHIDGHFNALRDQFDDSEDTISINAAEVETIDTSGLQSLLILVKTAKENGNTIEWQNVPEILSTGAKKIGIEASLAL